MFVLYELNTLFYKYTNLSYRLQLDIQIKYRIFLKLKKNNTKY